MFNKDFKNKEGKGLSDNPKLFESAINFLPAKKSYDVMFKNNGDLTFTDSGIDWDLNTQAFNSNGAAYADFDNDGDLDIVISNIEDKAVLYRNNISEETNSIKKTQSLDWVLKKAALENEKR